MGVRRYQDFIAWQLGEAFRLDVYRLVLGSEQAAQDLRYRGQILDAADGIGANIAEGFLRYSRPDFCRFLDYAIASLGEAERRLVNGIDRQYFDRASCSEALRLARRATKAMINLKRSQRAGGSRRS